MRIMGHYIFSIVALAIYGEKVCPIIESIGQLDWSIRLTVVFTGLFLHKTAPGQMDRSENRLEKSITTPVLVGRRPVPARRIGIGLVQQLRKLCRSRKQLQSIPRMHHFWILHRLRYGTRTAEAHRRKPRSHRLEYRIR